jgi:hypothetical protein
MRMSVYGGAQFLPDALYATDWSSSGWSRVVEIELAKANTVMMPRTVGRFVNLGMSLSGQETR